MVVGLICSGDRSDRHELTGDQGLVYLLDPGDHQHVTQVIRDSQADPGLMPMVLTHFQDASELDAVTIKDSLSFVSLLKRYHWVVLNVGLHGGHIVVLRIQNWPDLARLVSQLD